MAIGKVLLLVALAGFAYLVIKDYLREARLDRKLRRDRDAEVQAHANQHREPVARPAGARTRRGASFPAASLPGTAVTHEDATPLDGLDDPHAEAGAAHAFIFGDNEHTPYDPLSEGSTWHTDRSVHGWDHPSSVGKYDE